jgi:hypothetical protein
LNKIADPNIFSPLGLTVLEMSFACKSLLNLEVVDEPESPTALSTNSLIA